MKYFYLLLNIGVIFFPLILSFDKKVHFFSKWKFIFPSIFITGVLFLIWDLLFTHLGVWSFNPDYIVGIKLWGLPIEEIMFFLTVPYACVFIYECLNAYFPANTYQKYSLAVSHCIIGLCIAMLFFGYHRYYVLINFLVLIISLILVEYVNYKLRFMYRFYRAYLVTLIPFFIVNGYLTSLPVVIYNPEETLNFRIGTIPVEDMFYQMSLLLINVYLYEYFKNKATK